MIDVHYWPTPNGKKLTVQLEESGLDYNVVICEIGRGAQFDEEFLRISPNNRMPAIVDHAPADGGEPIAVFESGACMLYIAEKCGQFGGADVRERWEANQWLMWQMANQGPKFGERGHFARLKDRAGDQSYARARFDDEMHRLYGVMNNRLYDRRYLAGDNYTIADMACYPWVVGWEAQGIDINEFKYFARWLRELSERPALQRGMEVGAELSQDYSSLPKEELERVVSLLYNQRARPAPETGGILD
ncbi:MAG: glutathione S-transferase family protein [Halioglobus sp.]|nr:glutathione S-transferase family protein [Halioglobus sp.]